MRRRTFITLLAAIPAAACVRPAHSIISGLTMGTRYGVQLTSPVDDAVKTELGALIEIELAAINRAMSTYDPRSELSEFNRRQDLDWVPASQGLLKVLDSALRISDSTDGTFDVTVGPLVDLWGFGPQFHTRRVPGAGSIERVRERVGHRLVQTDLVTGAIRKAHSRTQIDLSAIAKGYGVDRVAMILNRNHIENYLVEIGGEFRARGHAVGAKPWRVAIDKPVFGQHNQGHTPGEFLTQNFGETLRDNPREYFSQTIALNNRAIATSGTTIDYFEQEGRYYSHSIDPRTGSPVEHPPMAVSVVADTTMEADGWATALLVLGPEHGYALAQARGLAALFVTASGSSFDVRVTDALRDHHVG